MKKTIYAMAFAAVCALTASCIHTDDLGEDEKITKSDIAFVIGSGATKADDSDAIETEVNRIPFTQIGDQQIFLEERVTLLDGPVTKGTPAYTENIADLYGTFKAVAYDEDVTEVLLDETTFEHRSDKKWAHKYTGTDEPWVEDKLHFFMHMPETMTGVKNLAYTSTTIKFDYDSRSLTTAESQKDLLFAKSLIKESDYDAKEGAKVLFYHALTGVKFAIGNDDDDTVITSVQFEGLYSTGKCTITPYYGGWSGDPESNAESMSSKKYNSESGVASGSKSYDCVSWTFTSADYDSSYKPYQEFASSGATADYKKGSYSFPDSFYAAGADDNLNTDNGTRTFWFIPQHLDESVKLTVTYTYKGTEYTQTLDFGKLAKGDNSDYPTWKAGELRTYTIKATTVGISITDKVNGKVKSDVVITNSGTSDAWVRATIIANWCDDEGNILAPWTPDIDDEIDSNWEYNSKDGFYYYKNAVPAGKESEDALFDSYTAPTTPTSPEGIDHLEMDIAVQALKKGSYTTYKAAWTAEAGVTFN